MADVTKTIGIVLQATDNVSPQLAGIEGSLRKITQQADLAAPQMDEAANSAKRLGDQNFTIRNLADAMQVLAGSIVVKEFIDANVAIENFTRAMTLVTGSTQGAAESLTFVKNISNTLGLEIGGATNNFLQLSAAAKGTALEGDGARQIFESVSKAMSLLGKSSADTGGALTAISQIISKGTVQSEELRGQLGERLPGAFQIAARAVGVTTQELGKLLETGQVTAEDFLPKFADELDKTFGDTTYVVTFNAELNRLINSVKELAVAGGDAGIFGALTEGLSDLTKFVKSTGVEIGFLGDVFTATRGFLLGGGEDWATYGRNLRDAGINAGIASAAITNTNESLAETSRLSRQAATDALDWSQAANQSAAETQRLFGNVTDEITKTTEAYKLLGIDSKKVNADFVGALEVVVNSAVSTNREVEKALTFVIPKIENAEELERFSAAAAKAATDGKITWAEWAVTVDKASEAFLKNTGYVSKSSSEVKKQADETKRAEENTAKLALELEKLASNERIKSLEFKAEIQVAQIQADAQKVVAAFEAITVGIQSTENVLGDLFGLFGELNNLDAAARNAIFAQIDKENLLREKAFELQKELTQAQIENLRAQTRNLEKGDALIKIDGAGLQPHLEAFMWEILKTVQTRVNSQGLALLLGLP